MVQDSIDFSDRDRQVNEIISDYLGSVDAGQVPDRQEWLRRYPEFAAELEAFLADYERMDRLAAPLRPAATTGVPTAREGTVSGTGFSVGATMRYLGDYELLEEVARGGMGVVYKARQISLNRIVAVKMILAGLLASQADRDRFHSEAQAAALLDHPNIKPSNVLIDCKGRPRVTDFGLAKQVGGGSDLTVEGQVLGTPSYMPPEQAAGQVNAVGPAADVYSLGALLYAMLAGRPPFQAAMSLETLRQVIESEPVALRQLDPGVPRDLETIVLKCLEKAIPRRYATAQALAEDLRRYLEGRPILARPVGRWERAWRWCRRQPAVAGLIAAVALTLATGILVSSLFAANAYRQAKVAREKAELAQNSETQSQNEKVRANQKADEADRNAKRAEFQLLRFRTAKYSTQVGLAQRDLLDTNYGDAEGLLDGCPVDLRGWEHRYLCAKLCKRRMVLKGHTSKVLIVAFSPDGRRIVSGSSDGTIKVWDAGAAEETLKQNTPGHN